MINRLIRVAGSATGPADERAQWDNEALEVGGRTMICMALGLGGARSLAASVGPRRATCAAPNEVARGAFGPELCGDPGPSQSVSSQPAFSATARGRPPDVCLSLAGGCKFGLRANTRSRSRAGQTKPARPQRRPQTRARKGLQAGLSTRQLPDNIQARTSGQRAAGDPAETLEGRIFEPA